MKKILISRALPVIFAAALVVVFAASSGLAAQYPEERFEVDMLGGTQVVYSVQTPHDYLGGITFENLYYGEVWSNYGQPFTDEFSVFVVEDGLESLEVYCYLDGLKRDLFLFPGYFGSGAAELGVGDDNGKLLMQADGATRGLGTPESPMILEFYTDGGGFFSQFVTAAVFEGKLENRDKYIDSDYPIWMDYQFAGELGFRAAVLTRSQVEEYASSGILPKYISYSGDDLSRLTDLTPLKGLLDQYISGGAAAEPPPVWAAEAVSRALELKIVPKSLQGDYGQAVTRAEFCALAVELFEEIAEMPIPGRAYFNDTSDVNVEKMAALGVVNGVGGGSFNPEGQLTREQAAAMLSRLAAVIGRPLENAEPTFKDSAGIANYAIAAVGQMQRSGIMTGVGDNTFSPAGAYTRAQSILTIMRLYDAVK